MRRWPGLIDAVFDLAAADGIAIARGDCFGDCSTRTAFGCRVVCLDLTGIQNDWDNVKTDQTINRCATGQMKDGDLADWLRKGAP